MLRCQAPVRRFLQFTGSKKAKKEKNCDEIANAVVKEILPQHSFYVLCIKKDYEKVDVVFIVDSCNSLMWAL